MAAKSRPAVADGVEMVRQAYPVAVEMPDGVVPAGKPISLPKDKADALAERFGTVEPHSQALSGEQSGGAEQ